MTGVKLGDRVLQIGCSNGGPPGRNRGEGRPLRPRASPSCPTRRPMARAQKAAANARRARRGRNERQRRASPSTTRPSISSIVDDAAGYVQRDAGGGSRGHDSRSCARGSSGRSRDDHRRGAASGPGRAAVARDRPRRRLRCRVKPQRRSRPKASAARGRWPSAKGSCSSKGSSRGRVRALNCRRAQSV